MKPINFSMQRLSRFVVVAALVFLLINCSRHESVGEQTFTATQTMAEGAKPLHTTQTRTPTPLPSPIQNPCQPPCWYNITPGKTKIAEAVDILESLPFIGDFQINRTDSKTELVWDRMKDYPFSAEAGGRIEAHLGIVKTIDVIPSRSFWRAGELVEAYGEPEVIKPVVYGEDPGFFDVHFWYPGRGIVVTVEGTLDQRGPCLFEDASIRTMNYSIAGSLDDMLNVFGETRQRLSEWPGFGCSFFD